MQINEKGPMCRNTYATRSHLVLISPESFCKVVLTITGRSLRGCQVSVNQSAFALLWDCFATLCDWSKKLAPLSSTIRDKIKTNRDLPAHIVPWYLL